VGAILWLYLQREAICGKTSFFYRSFKGYTMACLHFVKRRRPAAQGAEVEKSEPLL